MDVAEVHCLNIAFFVFLFFKIDCPHISVYHQLTENSHIHTHTLSLLFSSLSPSLRQWGAWYGEADALRWRHCPCRDTGSHGAGWIRNLISTYFICLYFVHFICLYLMYFICLYLMYFICLHQMYFICLHQMYFIWCFFFFFYIKFILFADI